MPDRDQQNPEDMEREDTVGSADEDFDETDEEEDEDEQDEFEEDGTGSDIKNDATRSDMHGTGSGRERDRPVDENRSEQNSTENTPSTPTIDRPSER